MDERASTLQAEYVAKACQVDQSFAGTQVGRVGRVERELSSYGDIQGLMFGALPPVVGRQPGRDRRNF